MVGLERTGTEISGSRPYSLYGMVVPILIVDI